MYKGMEAKVCAFLASSPRIALVWLGSLMTGLIWETQFRANIGVFLNSNSILGSQDP